MRCFGNLTGKFNGIDSFQDNIVGFHGVLTREWWTERENIAEISKISSGQNRSNKSNCPDKIGQTNLQTQPQTNYYCSL